MTKRALIAKMDQEEAEIASKVGQEWTNAAKRILEAGHPVTGVKGTRIVMTYPDGTAKVIGSVGRRVRVKRPLQGKVVWLQKGSPASD